MNPNAEFQPFSHEYSADDFYTVSTDAHLDATPVDYHYAIEPDDLEDEQQERDAVTQTMYANGIDMQGIRWNKQGIAREAYREQRSKQYINYLSLKKDDEDDTIEHKIRTQKLNTVRQHDVYYNFKFSKLSERCSIGHFQLRNLLWATSKNYVYYTSNDCIRQWCPSLRQSRNVLDLTVANIPGSLAVKISSMACAHDILLVGGFMGEVVCKRLDDINSNMHYGRITDHTNGIANHIAIIPGKARGTKAIISSNDQHVRFMNLDTMAIETNLEFPFPVNCASLAPDQQLLCIVGDSTETRIVDTCSRTTVITLDEHHDFSFSCCWSPNGYTLATGNQDKTTRIYDIRNPSKALHVLGAKIGAVRSLHFSNNGKYLAAAEPIDFVHIYETSTFTSSQVIDMFGDIAGIAFTPDDESFYIANTDDRVGGLFEFQRRSSQFDASLFY
ncbi:WD40-repeat-containing domain protein [Radiomyces spectabilis]|uniref:WD40-repeat-containing domain protein n=1 Tax=Radiomyces spectabilis TaxID=64574 RepID=UPI00221FF738|nr:WD40-repeat-containing domain protein [Radiomyces spectabilis]KAI8372724.1 WD40-repeat-containing domain protein [Radiomyces spectabilis]